MVIESTGTVFLLILLLAVRIYLLTNVFFYNKSRMMGDYHVRFCERLRVKLPLPTRLLERYG